MPPFGRFDGLVADVAVDLTGEGVIAQAEAEAVGDDLVQHIGGGDTAKIVRFECERGQHHVAHLGELAGEESVETQVVGLIVGLLEVVVEPDAEKAGADADGAEFAQAEPLKPFPAGHWRDVLANVDEHDTDHHEYQSCEDLLGEAEFIERAGHC